MKHQPESPAPVEPVSPFAELLDMPRHGPSLDDGDGDDGSSTTYIIRLVLDDSEDDEDLEEPEDDPPRRSWPWVLAGLLLGFGA